MNTNLQFPCGCCEGIQLLTPLAIANRPGLDALRYRVGTHAMFLETMKARLSNHYLEIPLEERDAQGMPKTARVYPLKGLTTRAENDPAIALLDAWATVAHVLTFYQERIANEGYLRTATERRSVLELARLIGYAPRPGVAASAWLALALEKDYQVAIQAHEIKAQSLPGPGELPQIFESVEALDARHAWNKLQPRMTRPQTEQTIKDVSNSKAPLPRVYLKGIATNLKPNDPLLIDFGSGSSPQVLYRVMGVKPDAAADRTLVIMQTWRPPAKPASLIAHVAGIAKSFGEVERFGVSRETEMAKRVLALLNQMQARLTTGTTGAELAAFMERETLPKLVEEHRVAVENQHTKLEPWLRGLVAELGEAYKQLSAGEAGGMAIGSSVAAATPIGADPTRAVLSKLTLPASIPPANTLRLERKVAESFALRADTGLQLVTAFQPSLLASFPTAVANAAVTEQSPIRVCALRVNAALFGHNASRQPVPVPNTDTFRLTAEPTLANTWRTLDAPGANGLKKVALDAVYDKITPGSFVAIDRPIDQDVREVTYHTVVDVQQVALEAVAGLVRVTVLTLNRPWLTTSADSSLLSGARQNPSLLRGTTVYTQSEELPLAEEPIDDPVCDGAGETNDDWIELAELYSGLQSGRWLVFSGERTDIPGTTGVRASELVMLAGSEQRFDPTLRGDETHTFLKLAAKLAYCYKRDTATIYANVVKATHGETRKETLGSGDASQALQSFTLKQPPLTFVASPTPAGAESTLKVYVNDVQWREADGPADLAPTGRKFVTKADDEGKTTVVFGNGQRGARLPTGIENVRAVYRSALGRRGNVRAEQVSLLLSKPLGVKGVVNPLRASGGADRESRDAARKNAPLTVTALDRLISVPDYADFARTFAGIGKAIATRLSDGRRQVVHVTIAGADDIPIDETSDLYRNLLRALRDYGDPHQPVALQVRELMLLVISAGIRTLPDYQWETVAQAARARLLDTFSFERREPGQDASLSEVIAALQSVRGVAYVDVDVLGGLPEKTTDTDAERRPTRRLLTPKELAARAAEFVQNATAGQPKPRVPVNLAGFEQGAMRPAQIAYLTPDVADTLALNQIK